MVQSKNVRVATESYVDGKVGSGGSSSGYPNTLSDVALGTGDGRDNLQTIGTSFTTVQLNTEVSDPGNNFNASDYSYTVPSDGTYLIVAKVRPQDGQINTQCNFGVGVHTSNTDHPSFQWFMQYASSGGDSNRRVYGYQRMAYFSQGQQLKLYAYSDASGGQNISAATLTIVRLV